MSLGGQTLNASITSTSIDASIPADLLQVPGTLSGVIANPTPGGGAASFSISVLTAPPQITGFSPSEAGVGVATDITVTGANFQASSVITVAGTRIGTDFISNTELSGQIPSALLRVPGEFGIGVFTPPPGGGEAGGGTLLVRNPVPELSDLSPSRVSLAELPVEVTVSGSGFLPTSVVHIDGSRTETTFVDSGTLIFSVGDAAVTALTLGSPTSLGVTVAGTLAVTVVTPAPGGGISNALSFAIGNPVPVIEAIDRVAARVDQLPVTLTLTGSGFIPTSTVSLGDGRYLDATTIEVTVPRGTAAGEHMITVTNPVPGGGTSNDVMFTVTNAAPVLTSLSPERALEGAVQTIDVGGENFVDGSEILIDGVALPTRFNGPTSLGGTFFGLLIAGTYEITVASPGAPDSNGLLLTVLQAAAPVPDITSITDPDTVSDGDTVTITGTGFLPTLQLTLDGRAIVPTRVTSTTIQFTVPTDGNKDGSHTLSVTNPPSTGGGGGSDSFSFTTGSTTDPDSLSLSGFGTILVSTNSAVSVSINNVRTAATSVTLTSSAPTNAGFLVGGSTVSSTTVQIPAGSLSTIATIRGLVAGTTTISASTSGVSTISGPLVVISAFGTISVTLSGTITIPQGGSTSFTVTRSSDTESAELEIGASTAATGIASVGSSLEFSSGSLTTTGTLSALAVGSTTLTVAGPRAPSLLNGEVLNFVPSGVSVPTTVAQQTSGTNLTFSGSVDDGTQLVGSATTPALPFSFPFFGTNHSSLYVNINGNLTFGSGDSTFNFSESTFLSRARISALATDLYIVSGSKVFTNSLTVGGTQAFAITYEKMGLFGKTSLGGLSTFQIVLFSTGAIQYRYVNINNEVSTTESDFWVGVSPDVPKYERPHGVWSDGTNLYTTSRENHTVRQISLSTGRVTTLAGNGISGTADGTGLAARFDETAGIWGDGNGNLYVAERNNFAIRKVVIATGEVTTIAELKGTSGMVNATGTAARFGELGGIWGDTSGNLYVADAGNHVIRKIVISTGVVTTLAGTFGATGLVNDTGAVARFHEPWGVWGDDAGNLYVGEDTNASIRKIVISTGAVTTLAGSATSGTADGTGGAAGLDRPRGLWGDGDGNLYVSEVGNHAIRKVVIATGAVTTLAGLKGTSGFADGVGTVARFDFPNAIFGDATYLYIVDDRNHVIRRMRMSTNEVTAFSGWVDNSGLQSGTGALTPTPQPTVHDGTNTIPNGFIFEKANPSTQILAVTRTVVVTGTPTLTSVSPSSGARGAAVAVTLTGTGFVSGGTTVAVSGSDVAVSSVNVTSTTSLTATFTVGSGATLSGRTVTVTTGAGTSGSQTFTVVLAAPTITSISPTSGKQGATVPVTITGTNFSGTAVNVSGTGAYVSGFTIDSATQITAVLILSGATGTRTVSVTTSGSSNTSNFTINSSAIASAGTFQVETLAGSKGFGSEDGTGPTAAFNQPAGVWADSTNLYVADKFNHTIRKVVISSGVVTTLAGSPGQTGLVNDTGSAARFNQPTGVWGDGSGNLYVVDKDNHAVRKVVISTGVVTTLAGSGSAGSGNGVGASAQFRFPQGLWGDDTGNLFIADGNNYLIRQIVISTATVTTLAGSSQGEVDNITGTSAKFNFVAGVTGDGAGNLYIADSGNKKIRKIVISTTEVTSVAGSFSPSGGYVEGVGATAQFRSLGGIWYDGSGNLFVAGTGNDVIRKIVISSATVSTFAGTGSAGFVNGNASTVQFDNPSYLFGAGNKLYVTEQLNHAIRQTDLTSVSFTTLAGSPNPKSGSTDASGDKARFKFPGGTWGDGQGNLYVSDTNNHTIRKIVISGGATTTLAGTAGSSGTTDGTGSAARFSFPEGLWGDGLGNLYATDTGNHTIRKIVISTGVVTTLAGTAGTSGTTDGTGTAAFFNAPHALWGDAATLYIADKDNHSIRKIVVSSGVVTTFAGQSGTSGSTDASGTSALFNLPLGIWGDNTNLYVTEGGNHTIRKIVISNQAVTTFAGVSGTSGSNNGTGTGAKFNFPHSVWGDGTNLYVVDLSNHVIRQVAISSAAVITPAGSAGNAGFVAVGSGSSARLQ